MKAELIDNLGSDIRVVDAARVSFDKLAFNYTDAQNGKLIKYLAEHGHFTPFTHCMITLRETVPIFVARQRFKHTVGFSYNEISRRYVDDDPEFYYPEGWRKRADNKKQGSSDELVDLSKVSWHGFKSTADAPIFQDWSVEEEIIELYDRVLITYKRMLDAGVAPEQARMVLPQSMFTSYYVTGSLAGFARAYRLRSDPHAQKEIQDLAKQWDEIIRLLYPISWSALVD